MTTIRWIASGLLFLFSGLGIMANLWIMFGGLIRKREKFESLIPFVVGIAGAVGVLLLPIDKAHAFWWVPIVADVGCGLMLLFVLIDQIKKRLPR